MKRLRSIIAGISTIMLVGLIAACGNPLLPGDPGDPGQPAQQSGDVIVHPDASSARSIIPDVASLVSEYEVRLARADYDDVIGVDAGPVTLTAVAIGAWEVTVMARDAGGELIGTGSGAVQVEAGTTTTVSISVVPQTSGDGSLDFEVTWSPVDLIASVSNAFLTPEGESQGSDIAGSFAVSSGSASYVDGSLASGMYTFVVKLGNGSGDHVATVVEAVHIYDNVATVGSVALGSSDVAQAPQAPGTLTGEPAPASPSDTITLTWSDPGDIETGFEIERSDDGGSTWVAVAGTGANVTSLDDTGLTSGVTYTYRVRATNDFGASDWSPTAEATPAEPVDLAAGLVGEWLFGGTLENTSSYTGPAYGTNGAIALTADRDGNAGAALELDSSADQATIYGYDALNSTPDGLTISFWMTEPTGNGRILSRRYGNGTSTFELDLWSGSMRLSWGGYNKTSLGTAALDQPWNHVVWVIDTGSADVVRAFVNGALVVESRASNTFDPNRDIQDTSSTNPITIGRAALSGAIISFDDLRVWNRALNASEVVALSEQNGAAATGGVGELAVNVGGTDATNGSHTHDFGSVAGSGPAGPVGVTLENLDGTYTFDVADVWISDETNFSLETTGTAGTVNPGGSRSFSVSFHPQTLGSHSASVHIRTTDIDEGEFSFTVRGFRLSEIYVSTSGSDANGTGTRTNPFATIQHAIDQAVAGQEVRVASGTYQVTFPGIEVREGVSLYGGYAPGSTYRDPDTYVTIIEDTSPTEPSAGAYDYAWSGGTLPHGWNHPTSALRAVDGVTRSTVIDGFTIRGTTNASRPPYAGGVYLLNASPTLSNNIIVGGNGATAAPGIRLHAGGSPLIEQNSITGGNTNGTSGSPTSLAVGGWLASPEFIDNLIDGGTSIGTDGSTGVIQVGGSGSTWTFRGNTITSGSSESGLNALMRIVSASAVVDKNRFVQTFDRDYHHGQVFDMNRSDVVISNNLIEITTPGNENVVAMHFLGMTADVVGNTVVHSNDSSASFNYGIYITNYGTTHSDVTIRNNVSHANGTSSSYKPLFVEAGSSATVENNYVTAHDQDLTSHPYYGSGGNVLAADTSAAESYFVDFAGRDFRPASAAPINLRAGGQNLADDGYDSLVESDYDGNARTVAATGTATNSGAEGWSMGAFEQDN